MSTAVTHVAFFRRYAIVTFAVMLVVLMGAIAASGFYARGLFERELRPEISSKAATMGRVLGAHFEQEGAGDAGLAQMPGVDAMFSDVRRDNPEFAYLALLDTDGKTLHQSGTPGQGSALERVTLMRGKAAIGELQVTLDPAYIPALLRELTLDVLVIVVVSLFIALELLYFLAGNEFVMRVLALKLRMDNVLAGNFVFRARPAAADGIGRVHGELDRLLGALNDARVATLESFRTVWRTRHGGKRGGKRFVGQARLDAFVREWRALGAHAEFNRPRVAVGGGAGNLTLLRAPLFLALLAEDLSRSFIPLYAKTLVPAGVPTQLLVSLPIMMFMLIVALSQPLLGGWSERAGRRNSLVIGMLTGALAHLLSASAATLWELLAWRSLAGASWAVVFVAAQGYVLDRTNIATRTQGLAFFIGVIMVSSVCGPSVGGILADGLGYRATLIIAGALALIAAWLALRRIEPEAERRAAPPRTLGMHDFTSLLANRRFAVLTFAAAIPAKVILIAFCFYLIPLYVIEKGSNAAMAGRIIMLYSIVMVLLVPLAARYADHLQKHSSFVAVGLLLSGFAGLIMGVPLGWAAPVLMVLLLGVGQSVSIAPQAVMVAQACPGEIAELGEGAIYGVYRMMERIGNAAAPVIAALLVQFAGFDAAFMFIGAWLLLSAVVLRAGFPNTVKNAPAPG
jgi:MFS family permease